MKSTFLKTLTERGFIHQSTHFELLDEACSSGSITAYIGFDATADSLHVGNLTQIMLLYWLQQTGHRPIVLMGGGTTKIGDPSGKDTARQLMSDEKIQENINGIQCVFSQFLTFGPEKAIMVNNNDWLKDLNYIHFLRDYGRHFSINRMLTFDSVRLRLEREQPLSFLEFNYMILQGYDFLELYQRYGCVLQMGGSDQWGNIVNGVDLTRRITGKDVFGLTTPLITTSSGAKMGKTAQGALWLNANKVAPYDYWQFWRNTEDPDVVRYLKLFTVLPMEEINQLALLQGSQINEAKKILADEATALVHGRECLESIHATIAHLFEKKEGGSLEDLPTISVSHSEIETGFSFIEAMIQLGLSTSKGEARRLIQGGGARLNDITVTDILMELKEKDFFCGKENKEKFIAKISAGKKRHGLIELEKN